MAAQKFLGVVSGEITQIASVDSSAGAGDGGKLVALDSTGKINPNMYDSGDSYETYTASGALSAGDFVNIFNDSGTAKVRKASSTSGFPAHGYVTAAVSDAASANVYSLDGVNSSLSGLTVGAVYWLSATGSVSTTPVVDTAGYVNQKIGIAKSATELRTDDYGYVIM